MSLWLRRPAWPTALAILIAADLLSCSIERLHHARYPSWDPTSPVVPRVVPRDVARRYLAESKKRWKNLEFDDYSYVRVREVSPERVELTVVVVENGRVVERSLSVTQPSRKGLGDHIAGKPGSALDLVWRERDKQLGLHEHGAPALTIDALYAICERQVLDMHPELDVRMFFHRDGVLQHCGFLVDDCPDCASVSIQTYWDFVPETHQQPTHYLCTDRYGASLPGTEPLKYAPCESKCSCVAFDPKPKAEPSTRSSSGLGNVCEIDPRACPKPGFRPGETPRAIFHCALFLGGGGLRHHCRPLFAAPPEPLRPDCIGLIKPDESPDEFAARCNRQAPAAY